MIKKKALFLALIGILATPLFAEISPLKEEPSDEVKQLYKEIESKISQLEMKTAFPPDLKDAEKEIEEISLMLKDIQPKTEPETAENRIEIKLDPASRALIDKKRTLQAELHIVNVPLRDLKDNLAALLKKKKELEAEYFLAQVETSILDKTTSELTGPVIIIEGEVELRRPDDINITLALNRSVAASAFCEVYLNDTLVKRERWKIGPKGEFMTTTAATKKAEPRQGPNNLVIVLNTGYQDDDVVIESPPFEKNPLAIFNESKISARNLLSGSFKLRQVKMPAGEQPDNPAEAEAPVEIRSQPPIEE